MPITKKTWVAGLFTLALATAGSASAEDVTGQTVLATVAGKDITVGHMAVAMQGLPAQFQQLDPAVLYDGLLDQLIHQTALAQSIEDVSDQAQWMVDNQTAAIIAAEALGEALDAAVTEDAIQAAYDAQFKDSAPETEYNAAHILVETEEEAAAIRAELDGGADFATLAREHSTGPSGPNGGDLGWFGKGMMVPDFEAAVFALEPGQVSDPVKTQFGWHVVQLNETRVVDAPALEEIREDIVAEVEKQLIQQVMSDVLAKTEVVRTDVEIDPAILADPAILER